MLNLVVRIETTRLEKVTLPDTHGRLCSPPPPLRRYQPSYAVALTNTMRQQHSEIIIIKTSFNLNTGQNKTSNL